MANVDIKIKFIEGAATASAKKFSNEIDGIQKGVKSLNLSLNSTSSFLKNFAANIASTAVQNFTSAIVGLAGEALNSARQLENISTQFEVLTGSTQSASALVKDLVEFTAKTPFRLEGVAAAGQRLLSFGFTTDEVKDRLQELGDVAAASGTDLGELALIFGQVRAAGKLTGERLLQLQERAIPIGPALAQTLGVAESAVRDLVSAGEVSFAEFEKAFQSLNEEGAFAFEGLIKQSRTFDGVVSTLQDNFSLAAGVLGQSVLPALKAIGITITGLIQQFINFAQTAEGLTDINIAVISIAENIAKFSGFLLKVGQVGEIVIDSLSLGFASILKVVLEVVEAFTAVGGAVAGIVGIDTSGLDQFTKSLSEFNNELGSDIETRAGDLSNSVENLGSNFAEVDKNIAGFNRTLRENFQNIQEQSKQSTDTTINNNNKIAQSEEALTAKQIEENQKRVEAAIQFVNKKAELDTQRALLEEEQRLSEDEILTEREQLQLEREKNRLLTIQEENQLANARLLDDQREFALLEAKIDNDRLKRKIELNKKSREVDQKESQDRLRTTSNLFGALANLSSTGGKKLFELTQNLQRAQIITAGAAAIQQAASAAPFPANLPGIAIETARAAASLIRVNQASFQQGGVVPGNSFSGDNVVARVNSGEMILNQQQQAKLFDIANGRSGGAKELVINTIVELDGDIVAKSVSRRVADGLELGVNT